MPYAGGEGVFPSCIFSKLFNDLYNIIELT